MKKSSDSLLSLGHEATNLSSEFANLPDKVHRAVIALEKLTEVENASQALSTLVEKLRAMIELTDQEIEGRATLNNSITEYTGNMTKAVQISEHLKITEGEFQQIIVGLNNVSDTLQIEGQRLSDALNHIINSVGVIPKGSRGKNSRRGWGWFRKE